MLALSLGLLLGRLGHDPRALLPQVRHGEGCAEADAVGLLPDLLQLGQVRDLEGHRIGIRRFVFVHRFLAFSFVYLDDGLGLGHEVGRLLEVPAAPGGELFERSFRISVL